MNDVPERSLGAMVRDIGGNVDRIVRAEVKIALAELGFRVEGLRRESVLAAAGAAAAMLAAAFVLLGGMFGLAHVMPLWLSALVVAALPAAVAAVLYIQVRGQRARRLASETGKFLSSLRGIT